MVGGGGAAVRGERGDVARSHPRSSGRRLEGGWRHHRRRGIAVNWLVVHRKASTGGVPGGFASVGISLLFAVAMAVGVGAPAAGDAGWSTDGSRWSGTGSVFVPGAGHVGTRPDDSSGCEGCQWQVVPVCGHEPVGFPCSETPWLRCQGEAERHYVIFTRGPGASPEIVAAPCIGPGQRPVSSVEMGREVAQRITSVPPRLRPTHQPRSGALTQLPAIFSSNQPTAVERDDVIAGFSTRMTARARWAWSWGDGTEPLTTARPGGVWPDRTVSHTYRRPGTVMVRVHTTWDARYWVNGAGPFRVTGDALRQTAELRLTVREARAVLVE